MAYWREYKNKYGTLINRALVYTAKDRSIQHARILNRAVPTQRRMYRELDRTNSIRYFIRSGDPDNRLLECWCDKTVELECKRVQLNLTRAILAGKRNWNTTVSTSHGITVGIHLSGNLNVIREAIYQLEYDLKFLQWVMRAYDKRLLPFSAF